MASACPVRQEHGDVPAADLHLVVAEDLLGTMVEEDDASQRVGDHDAVLAGVEQLEHHLRCESPEPVARARGGGTDLAGRRGGHDRASRAACPIPQRWSAASCWSTSRCASVPLRLIATDHTEDRCDALMSPETNNGSPSRREGSRATMRRLTPPPRMLASSLTASIMSSALSSSSASSISMARAMRSQTSWLATSPNCTFASSPTSATYAPRTPDGSPWRGSPNTTSTMLRVFAARSCADSTTASSQGAMGCTAIVTTPPRPASPRTPAG